MSFPEIEYDDIDLDVTTRLLQEHGAVIVKLTADQGAALVRMIRETENAESRSGWRAYRVLRLLTLPATAVRAFMVGIRHAKLIELHCVAVNHALPYSWSQTGDTYLFKLTLLPPDCDCLTKRCT